MEGLKDMRERQNLTQEEVAQAVGVSRVAVLKWEKRQCAPNGKYLPKLASLLKCSTNDILRFYE